MYHSTLILIVFHVIILLSLTSLMAPLWDLSTKERKTPLYEPKPTHKQQPAPPTPAGRQRDNHSNTKLRVLQERLAKLVQQIETLSQDNHQVEEEISFV